MDNKFECYYSNTENLWNIYYENMASIDKFAKGIFNASKYTNKPNKNLWDLSNLEIYDGMLESSAFQVANNNFREGDFHATLIGGNYDSSVLTGKRVAETLVFILVDNKIKLYISKAKFRYGFGIIAWGLIPHAIAFADTALNKKKREDKTLKTYVFSREDFLSRVSYNSCDVKKNNVSITIELDGKKHECGYLYQPYLHLFLYYIENGFKQTIPGKELQKIFLDKYILDMKNKPVIPTEDKEEKIKVLDERKGSIVKTRTIVDDGKKYDEYGFDKDGYNREGFDAYGYDRDGFNRAGYNKKGFDKYGFDKDGYNKLGLDKNGYDKDGYNRDGYDEDGYDKKGYDKDGFDKDGYNQLGFDAYGYDREGFDENGYDGDGYNMMGYDKNGYNRDGFNEKGINIITGKTYNEKGYDAYGNKKMGTFGKFVIISLALRFIAILVMIFTMNREM